MRHRVAFSGMTGLILVTMLTMTAIARDDETLGNGAPGAHLLGSLNILSVSNLKDVDMDSARGSTVFLPLAGKITVHLTQGYDFAVLDKNGTDGRAESQLPDPGIDPFIVGDPGNADMATDYSA